MLDTATSGAISKRQFEAHEPKLRWRLLQAHFALRDRKFPVLVLISGSDAAGKGALLHRLNEWLDPRGVETHAFWHPTDEEKERPYFWRFWMTMPPRGRVGLLLGSWYTHPIIERAFGRIGRRRYARELEQIAFHEKMLADDGTLILKLWLHLDRKQQRQRLEALESDPKTRWRVTRDDWKRLKHHDAFLQTSEQVLRATDTSHAPWHVIHAGDRRFCEMEAGRLLLKTLEKKPATPSRPAAPVILPRRSRPAASSPTALDDVDLTQRLSDDEYQRLLEKYQARLNRLTWEANRKGISSVVVFEGWDAAGKGSAIRRVTSAMDPRLYRIASFAAPTAEEAARHYLWRFWRPLPRAGRMTLCDRSWYGRVLVERVEGFATEAEWTRAYAEINNFEAQLAAHGLVLAKFWIHISKEEELRRFEERQRVPWKRYKITDEDWRNRSKWDAYERAVNDMAARTSTATAPWTLVAGNDKKFARIQILKTLCRNLKRA